jgi:hypothetical protein
VVPISVGDAFVYDLWIDQETGDDVNRCPWLEKALGSDHPTREAHGVRAEGNQAPLYPRLFLARPLIRY